MIPILDLTAQYRDIKPEIDAAIQGVLDSGSFIMGLNVKAFESEVAAYVGAEHAIAMNSGTDALHLALRALDIGPGDEVITSPFTFVATTEAIGIVGATPVFADIDPETLNIDPTAIEKAISPRTKAILPVHLYGLPAAMPAIVELARSRSIAIVEDCAQAIGAELDGTKVGNFGTIGCFSFFPSKNLGAYGDGGMATTNDGELAKRLRGLRVHGGVVKYYHDELGINSRLDEVQAAILRVKLRHLDAWTQARQSIAKRYDDAFKDAANIGLLNVPKRTRHVYHQYTVKVPSRDEVKARLSGLGVQTMVYYPEPLHLQQVHHSLGHKTGAFPHTELAARQVLSLPIYPELTSAMQQSVIHGLVNCCAELSVPA